MEDKMKLKNLMKRIQRDKQLTSEYLRETRIVTRTTDERPFLLYYMDPKRMYRFELTTAAVDIQKIKGQELDSEAIPNIMRAFGE